MRGHSWERRRAVRCAVLIAVRGCGDASPYSSAEPVGSGRIVKWLKATSPDPVSWEKYASRARDHITPYFGGRSIAGACTVDTVRDYLEWLNARGLDSSPKE